MEEDIKVSIVDEWPVEDIITLYKSGGWWKESYDKRLLDPMIKGSFAFAVALDGENRAVGMGRAISDGISDAYIQDVVVLPEYRGRGIGSEIITQLCKYCKSRGLVWIGLIAEPGTVEFYRRIGFESMKGHVPMLYKGGK